MSLPLLAEMAERPSLKLEETVLHSNKQGTYPTFHFFIFFKYLPTDNTPATRQWRDLESEMTAKMNEGSPGHNLVELDLVRADFL